MCSKFGNIVTIPAAHLNLSLCFLHFWRDVFSFFIFFFILFSFSMLLWANSSSATPTVFSRTELSADLKRTSVVFTKTEPCGSFQIIQLLRCSQYKFHSDMQASVLWEVFLNSSCGVMFPHSCVVSCYFELSPHLAKKQKTKKKAEDVRLNN